mgnify:CR=1 FL=1
MTRLLDCRLYKKIQPSRSLNKPPKTHCIESGITSNIIERGDQETLAGSFLLPDPLATPDLYISGLLLPELLAGAVLLVSVEPIPPLPFIEQEALNVAPGSTASLETVTVPSITADAFKANKFDT